jgi:hypothetical protein
MHARVCTVRELAIAGRLVAVGRNLIVIRGGLVAVGLSLVSVRKRLVGVGERLIGVARSGAPDEAVVVICPTRPVSGLRSCHPSQSNYEGGTEK